MKQLKVFKLDDNALIPSRSYPGDLGYDLFASETVSISKGEQVAVSTGISVEFPDGWGGFIKDRSSIAMKELYTSAGVIDNGYRGEIKIFLRNGSGSDTTVKAGEKIAQLVPIPVNDWGLTVVDDGRLSESNRGENGFGSSGA